MARRGGGTAGTDRRRLVINLRARLGEIDIFLFGSGVAGMGTTAVVALVADGRLTVGHVGDSRPYGLNRAQVKLHRAVLPGGGARAETGSARKLHGAGSPCYIR